MTYDCWAAALNGYTLAKKYEEGEKAATECKKRLPNVGYNQQVYYYRTNRVVSATLNQIIEHLVAALDKVRLQARLNLPLGC